MRLIVERLVPRDGELRPGQSPALACLRDRPAHRHEDRVGDAIGLELER